MIHRAFEERTQIKHDTNSLIKACILRVVYKKTVSPAGIKFRTDLYGSVSGPTLLVSVRHDLLFLGLLSSKHVI